MLLSVWDLITRSFRFYTDHWRSLLVYSLWLLLPTALSSFFGIMSLLAVTKNAIANIIILLVLIVIIIANYFLSLWITLSLTYAVGRGLNDNLVPSWKSAFTAAKPYIGTTFVAILLTTLIFLGGVIAAIIPAIIFTGWYLFVTYEVLFNNKTATSALRASKAMVVGRWWAVVSRFFIPVLFYVFFAYTLQQLLHFLAPEFHSSFYNQLTDNLLVAIASSLFAPLAAISTILLYNNLKIVPPPIKNP